MFNIVIFGAPGSGKGTQSEKLTDRYGLYHISTGEVLREHIAQGTELGIIADKFISEGKLIPDELVVDMLAKILDNTEEAKRGVIFDGFPRTINQAKALKTLLAERGAQVDAVIGLDVDENELIDRLILRGKQSGRSDDNLDTIRKRLVEYHAKTQPLHDYYIGEGSFLPVKGTGSIDEIFDRITAAVDARLK